MLRSSTPRYFEACAALLVVVAVVFVLVQPATAAMFHVPSKAYPSSVKRHYSWMCKSNSAVVAISVSDDTKKFMSEEDIRRYMNLKMRNFLSAYKLTEESSGRDHDYMSVYVGLFKYNDNIDVYTGLFSVKVESALSQGDTTEPYILAVGISGSDTQVVGQIKSHIDWAVENFAEDYYMVQDLIAAVEE